MVRLSPSPYPCVPAIHSLGARVWGRLFLLVPIFFMICFSSAGAQSVLAGGSHRLLLSGFNAPTGIAVDASGNLFILQGSTILEEKLQLDGTFVQNTITSSLQNGYGIALDASGNLYACDQAAGKIYRFALSAGVYGSAVTITASVPRPTGIAVDVNGNLYVTDSTLNNSRIYKIAKSGNTYAAPQVVFSGGVSYVGISVDANFNIYFTDTVTNTIYELNWYINRYPGLVTLKFTSSPASPLFAPSGIKVDGNENLYITDASNNRLLKETWGSNQYAQSTIDSINTPTALAVDAAGNVYTSNASGNIHVTTPGFGTIAIGSTSQTITFAFNFATAKSIGSPTVLTMGATGKDFADAGTGTCTTANGSANTYGSGATCTVDVTFSPLYPGYRFGAVQIVDAAQPANILATAYLVGLGSGSNIAFVPGTQSVAVQVSDMAALGNGFYPQGTILDGYGNLYTAEYRNPVILKTTPQGITSVVVDQSTLASGSTDLDKPFGLAMDGAGNLYIAMGTVILKETPTPSGYIQQVIMTGLNGAQGVAVDLAGNIYVANTFGYAILTGVLQADGSYNKIYLWNGEVSILGATMNLPEGIAVDEAGSLYVSDTRNNRVFKETLTNGVYVPSLVAAGLDWPAQVTVDGLGNVYIVNSGDGYRSDGAIYKESPLHGGYVQSVVSTATIDQYFYGVAIDATGNVYFSDNATEEVLKVDYGTAPTLGFESTPAGSISADSPKSVVVANAGNAPMVFSAPDSGTNASLENAGTETGFSWDQATTCPHSSAEGVLQPGNSCVYAIDFTPKSAGLVFGSVALSDNSLTATQQSQIIPLSGTGVASGDVTATSVQATPDTITAGQTVTITATITDNTHKNVTPTSGLVSFSDALGSTVTSLNAGSPVSVNSMGQAVLQNITLSGTGTHTITAAYEGVIGNQRSSTGSITIIMQMDTTAIAVSVSSNATTLGQPIQITATVADISNTAILPTGSVILTDTRGSVTSILNSGNPVPLSGGQAVLNNVMLSGVGSHVINATYSGLPSLLKSSNNADQADGGNNLTVYADNLPLGVSAPHVTNFEAVPINGSVTGVITFTFTGSGAIGMPQVLTQGAIGMDFTDAGDGSCTTSNGTDNSYIADATCTVNVKFTPKFAGTRTGAVIISDNSGNILATAYLQGTGIGPQIAYPSNPEVPIISTGLTNPASIAIDGAGNLYIADSGYIYKESVNGGSYLQSALASAPGVDAIAIDGAGYIYALYPQDANSFLLVKGVLNANRFSQSTIATFGAASAGLAVDGSGTLYVAANNPTSGTGTIYKETPSGGNYLQNVIASLPSSALTAVAVDGSGNVYVTSAPSSGENMIYEEAFFDGSYNQITVANLDANNGKPCGLAVDGVGNIYVADSNNDSVWQFTPTAGGYSTLQFQNGNQASPISVAIDPGGTLYIVDQAPADVRAVKVVIPPSLSYSTPTVMGSTDVADGAQKVTVENLGNQPLVFPAPLSGFNASVSSSLDYDDSTTCPRIGVSGTPVSLAAGSTCEYAIKFVPTASGTINTSVILTNNDLNGANVTQTISVTGTGLPSGDKTSTNITIGTTSMTYGQPISLIVTVTDLSNSGYIPTGTVSFTDQTGSVTTLLGSAILISGSATLSNGSLSGIGAHTITAAYAGENKNFGASSASALATVSKASSAVSCPLSQPVLIPSGQSGVVNLSVTGPPTAISAPTGSVSYSILGASGQNVSSGVSALSVASGLATASIPVPASIASGLYTVSASYSGDALYLASSGPTIITTVVGHVTPKIQWADPEPVTYGSALSGILDAKATVNSIPIPGAFTYTAAPLGGNAISVNATSALNAGSYTLTASYVPTNAAAYEAVTGVNVSLVVNPAVATITLGNLSLSYTGSALSATATTTPAGLPVIFTYNGSAVPPTAPGNYAVVATVNSANYSGSVSGNMALSKGAVVVALGSLTQIYTGSPLAATASTTPAGLPVSFTYNGSSTAPTAPGAYTVVATVIDPNYTGTATGTFTVQKIPATVTLSSLAQTYTGAPNAAMAVTIPAGLNVSFTYDGSATAPTNAGFYAVVATINDPTHSGTASATLVISKAVAVVTLGGLSGSFTGSQLPVSVLTTPSGLTMTITYNGSSDAPENAGSYAVIATVVDPNYAGSATNTLIISKATATVTLGGLDQTYSGSPLKASATTAPSGLVVGFTYNGSVNMPTSAGSYVVIGSIADPNYSGKAYGTLVIEQRAPTVSVISTANPVLSQLGITLTATVTSPAGTPVGSANFLDGTALLGNVTLLNGQATLSTSSLKVGVHQISVSYSGDSNFAPASSAVLSQAVLDFSVDLGSGSGDAGSASESTQTASSGAIATYSLQIVPTNGTILPAPVTLAVTGLPSGATANITPSSWSQGSNGVWTYPANTPVGSFTLSVNTPNASARLDDKSGSSSKAPLLFWSVLLLPLAASIRRARKLFLQLVASVLLICAGPVMSVGLGGCGSGSGTSIVQNAQQQTYTLTVTATSGPLSHALTLTLIVQ